MYFKHAKYYTIFFLFSFCFADNPHFFRATNFLRPIQEPRLDRPWLASFDMYVARGTTKTSRNACRDKTELLNIFGPENMVKVGAGVPCKDPKNIIDANLLQLAQLPCRDCFGQLLFCGKFELTEFNFIWTQNFTHGLFLQVLVPYLKMELSDVCFSDLSPCDSICPNKNTPEWQTFLCLFNQMLERYDLCVSGFKHNKIGDVGIFGGWTSNYQETEVLDYIDTTVRLGVVIPSGHESCPDIVFDLPTGYDGHTGIFGNFNGAIGVYDWLTIGTSIDALFFRDKTRCIRLKTDANQNGFIKLAQGKATIDKGTIWSVYVYMIADHVIKGFTLLGSYSFTNKRSDSVSPCDCKIFDPTVVCCDPQFQDWNQHVLHFLAEYDFSKECSRFGPKFGVFYNYQIGGKRVFINNMAGGIIGFDFVLKF